MCQYLRVRHMSNTDAQWTRLRHVSDTFVLVQLKKIFFYSFWTHFRHLRDMDRIHKRPNLDTFFIFSIYFNRPTHILKSQPNTQFQTNVIYVLESVLFVDKRDNNNGEEVNTGSPLKTHITKL